MQDTSKLVADTKQAVTRTNVTNIKVSRSHYALVPKLTVALNHNGCIKITWRHIDQVSKGQC